MQVEVTCNKSDGAKTRKPQPPEEQKIGTVDGACHLYLATKIKVLQILEDK